MKESIEKLKLLKLQLDYNELLQLCIGYRNAEERADNKMRILELEKELLTEKLNKKR